jgi:pimeloyl-ACP methyl ester carboxylesterase
MLPLPDGGWSAATVLTPKALKVRGLALMPSNSIIPVIVVPGIMGSNLRAKRKPRTREEQNLEATPGEPVWRPPNTLAGGLWDALTWDRIRPARRQRLLDAETLEVDDDGPPHIPHGDGRLHIHPRLARERGWGELHADCYGGLLCALETRLNQTFLHDDATAARRIQRHWQEVMACDPNKWGMPAMMPLTEAALEKHAQHHYPVYGVGYNWLDCCEKASQRLERRIVEIVEYWTGMKRQCERVILVTHSMGGLVARACAKRIPDRIAGAMTYDTTPVLATSPGALELLPNHLYPGPWLHVAVEQPVGAEGGPARVLDYFHLPNESVPNPYDLYRNLHPWYRLVDPALADPAGKYRGKSGEVVNAIKKAINTAERFHRQCLGEYYHPNTYAFYGSDPGQRAFGHVRWLGRKETGLHTALTPANVNQAKFTAFQPQGGRLVDVDPACSLLFRPEPPDSRGDRTVPSESGAGPAGKVQHLFETRGYDHQGAFNNEDVLMLTLRLVVRIVQGMP